MPGTRTGAAQDPSLPGDLGSRAGTHEEYHDLLAVKSMYRIETANDENVRDQE